MEPQFDEIFEEILLVKSGNLVTEQFLSVSVQVEQPNATFTEAQVTVDYQFGTGGKLR